MVFSRGNSFGTGPNLPNKQYITSPRTLQKIELGRFEQHMAQISHQILPVGPIVEKPLPVHLACENPPGLVDQKLRLMERTSFGTLYLGSRTNVSNGRELAIRTRTTHVLWVGDEVYQTLPEEAQTMNIKLHNIHMPNIKGGECQDILQRSLNSAISYVRKAITENQQHVVLVACGSGARYSPAVVIGYLMQYEKMSLNEAYTFVRQRSPGIAIAPALLQELGVLEMKINPRLQSPTMRTQYSGRVGAVFMCEHQRVEPTFLRAIVHGDDHTEGAVFHTDKLHLGDGSPREYDRNFLPELMPTFMTAINPTHMELDEGRGTFVFTNEKSPTNKRKPEFDSANSRDINMDSPSAKRIKAGESIKAGEMTLNQLARAYAGQLPSFAQFTRMGSGLKRKSSAEMKAETTQEIKRTRNMQPDPTAMHIHDNALTSAKAGLSQVYCKEKFGVEIPRKKMVACPKTGQDVPETLFEEYIQFFPADIWPRMPLPSPYPAGSYAGLLENSRSTFQAFKSRGRKYFLFLGNIQNTRCGSRHLVEKP